MKKTHTHKRKAASKWNIHTPNSRKERETITVCSLWSYMHASKIIFFPIGCDTFYMCSIEQIHPLWFTANDYFANECVCVWKMSTLERTKPKRVHSIQFDSIHFHLKPTGNNHKSNCWFCACEWSVVSEEEEGTEIAHFSSLSGSISPLYFHLRRLYRPLTFFLSSFLEFFVTL